jgi:hypothetical protein
MNNIHISNLFFIGSVYYSIRSLSRRVKLALPLNLIPRFRCNKYIYFILVDKVVLSPTYLLRAFRTRYLVVGKASNVIIPVLNVTNNTSPTTSFPFHTSPRIFDARSWNIDRIQGVPQCLLNKCSDILSLNWAKIGVYPLKIHSLSPQVFSQITTRITILLSKFL